MGDLFNAHVLREKEREREGESERERERERGEGGGIAPPFSLLSV